MKVIMSVDSMFTVELTEEKALTEMVDKLAFVQYVEIERHYYS